MKGGCVRAVCSGAGVKRSKPSLHQWGGMVSTRSSGSFFSFSTADLRVNFFDVMVYLAPEGIWLVVSIQGKNKKSYLVGIQSLIWKKTLPAEF